MSRPEALEHLRAGHPQAAAELLESHLRTEECDAQGWFLLGACRHALTDLAGARAAFSHSIALEPGNPEAHLANISVVRAAGDAHAASTASLEAVARFPGDARFLYAAALSLEDLGRDEHALALYDRALGISPDFEDALHNRGLLLARLERFDDALINQQSCVEKFPQATRARSALVDVLLAMGQFDAALIALDELERNDKRDNSARIRRGVALASLRRFPEARKVIAEARARDPQAAARYLQRVAPGSDPELMLSPENIYLWSSWRALERCDWSAWDGYVAEMRRVAREPDVAIEPAVAFMSRLLPLDGGERRAIARHVAAAVEVKYPALPPAAAHQRPRIRIGVLSPDFREHLNSYLLLPFFELLDRQRFELYAYSLSVDDGSAIRARLGSAADGFRDLQRATDRAAARAIRNDDLDILLDVGGYTTGARFEITAQRPARLQVNYLGYSSSLASSRIDYAIVDRIAGGDDAEWAEARVFLPDTHFLYDFRTSAPRLNLSRRDYGLPDEAFVYCAFHRAEKITPEVFALWMEILAQTPQSILWFRALSDVARKNLCKRAAQLGVNPERLSFAPFEPSRDPRYLARHRLGDLMLDALHHNATTTACDALGAGLPLLTVQGTAMAARTGESLLRAAGLPDLVARDRDAYLRIAMQLAKEPAALRTLKQRLAENRRSAPLFDTAARVRALETAFQLMVKRMLRGKSPTTLEL